MSSSGSILKDLGVKPKSTNEINPAGNSNVVLTSGDKLSDKLQPESKDEFSYYFINKLLRSKEEKGEISEHNFNEYTAVIKSNTKSHIFFMRKGYKKTNKLPDIFMQENPLNRAGILFFAYGLKFHISLPDIKANEKSWLLGWDIVKNVLMEEKINTFKVIAQGEKGQIGKDIVIYASENPEFRTRDWNRILNEITQKLTAANIPAGFRPVKNSSKPEKDLPSCSYIAYRYKDESKDTRKMHNKHVIALIKKDCNTSADRYGWPKSDFVDTIKIQVKGQPSVPTTIDSEKVLLIDPESMNSPRKSI